MFEIINEVGFGKGPHAKLTRGQASTRFMMCFTYIKCFSCYEIERLRERRLEEEGIDFHYLINCIVIQGGEAYL